MELANTQQDAQTDAPQPTETPIEGQAGTTADAAKPVTLESVEKEYFTSLQVDKAGEAISKAQEICAAVGISPTYNFDIEEEFEQGYGIVIDHIAKRSADGNKILGILIGAVPDFETVMEADNGAVFIKDSVIDKMLGKLKNAVRPRGEDNTVSASVPFSIVDFITSNRPEGILIAFNSLAPAYVKMLKKKGLSLMTVAILRQTLQSASFAEQNFPKITQEKWLTILDSMITKTEKDGKSVGILTDWKKTRASAEITDGDVDLSDLDFDKI